MSDIELAPYPTITATYDLDLGRRYRGNPFAEALPIEKLTTGSTAILDALAFYPPAPTDADRKKSRFARLCEVNNIFDLIYPRPAYQRAGDAILANLVEAYVPRNVLTVEDRQRRYRIANITPEEAEALIRGLAKTGAIFGKGWRQSALGFLLCGMTGTGKSTFLRALLQYLAVVIEHTEYRGAPLNCKQVPLIYLPIPHDSTLRTFCVAMADVIDVALGMQLYGPRARGCRTIGAAASLLFKAITSISLGGVLIDDLQNLRAASTEHAAIALNLFSLMMEIAGVSVTCSGTPALGPLIEDNVRNTRKLTSGGQTVLELMDKNSKEYRNFQDTYWRYQYTSQKQPLTQETRNAWFAADAGHPAFCSLAFLCTQRGAISESGQMNAERFHIARTEDMALLLPAIEALHSGESRKLSRFEDLMFTDALNEIRAGNAAGPSAPQPQAAASESLPASTAPSASKRAPSGRRPAKKRAGASNTRSRPEGPPHSLPPEDPLSLV